MQTGKYRKYKRRSKKHGSLPGEVGRLWATKYSGKEFYGVLTIESIRAAVEKMKEYTPF